MCFLCKLYYTDLITSCHRHFLEGFHVIFYVMENEVCSLFKFKTTTGCNGGLLNCIQVSVTGPHVFVFLVNFYILSPWFAFHLVFEDSHLCHVRLMNAQSWLCLHSGYGNLTKEFIKWEKKIQSGTCFFFFLFSTTSRDQAVRHGWWKSQKRIKKFLLISNYLSVSHDTKIFTWLTVFFVPFGFPK